MRKVAILLVLLACDSESETFRCADWLGCYNECRAFGGPVAETSCSLDCDINGLETFELAEDVRLNDAWLEQSFDGILEREPKPFYDALADATRACYSAP